MVQASGSASLVADIYSGVNGSSPSSLVVFNDKLYFAADGNNGAGSELWMYDGSNPPSLVADIYSGLESSSLRALIVFNNKLYFAADGNNGAGSELWVYDGVNSPSMVADIYSGKTGSMVYYPAIFNNKLYFSANASDGKGVGLFVYDGVNSPSRIPIDNSTGYNTRAFPSYLTVYNGKLYFGADGQNGYGQELWVYDGVNTPSRLTDLNAGTNSALVSHLIVFKNKLHFYANDGSSNKFWAYDGTTVSSVLNMLVYYPAIYNGNLYFQSNGSDGTGSELWTYDGVSVTSRVADINSGSSSSSPQFLTLYKNQLYFRANNGTLGLELWRYKEEASDVVSPKVLSSSPANGATVVSFDSLTVTFSEDALHDGSLKSANHTDNYLLVEEMRDGFQTTACNSTDFVHDRKIPINSVTYENHGGSGPFSATLKVNDSSPLPSGYYRFFICGSTSITDLAGNELNSGTDTIVNFTITGDASSADGLPGTGFPPERETSLNEQLHSNVLNEIVELSLEIPKLHIKGSILGVPLIDGTWDVSWLGDEIGYLYGTTYPTWPGNTLLSAHSTGSDGAPGPFYRLNSLRWGDEIHLMSGNVRYTYMVQKVNDVNPTDLSILESPDNRSWITLVSCRGYDEKTDSYLWRTVVQAVLVSSE